ncbi:probable arylamine N-acetyltransferase [Coccomyxa sp. Obi]|nr:probable arylamine N-acetyltransferase [Coccomyxa sp. Obi]
MGFIPSVPSLDIDAIFRKIVQQQKGGYCFEHNGLMSAVLQSLGYELYASGANVVRESSEAAARGQVDLKGYSHEVLIVRGPEDDRWRLVDAGFGGITPTQPLVLQHPAYDSFTGDTVFRVRRGMLGRVAQPSQEELEREGHACGWYMQRYSHTEKRWQDQYFFREVENTPGDFVVMNWAVATDPAKGFYHTLMMGIQQPDGGRVTVMDDILRVYKNNGDVEEQTLDTPELFQAALAEHFSITPVT